MPKYLVISALGENRPGIVEAISEVITENRCNIEESRMATLGGEFAMLLLVSGPWNAIAKLEGALESLGEREGLTVVTKRTEPKPSEAAVLPYLVEVVSMDHPGIVHEVADFFARRHINIQELNTDSYRAPHTGTPIFNMSMRVDVPTDTSIGALREAFMTFCDELNLDAVMEPLKGR